MFAPTRWLLELYPIDEILASRAEDRSEEHPLRDDADRIAGLRSDRDRAGRRASCSGSTFEPAIVERPFFDRFPDYEHVRVTTGWIKADVAGRTVVDERIATDPERFWDRFQSKTLPALYDHVMALGNGKPRAGGRAVLRRADRRSHAQRAGVPAAGRPGADLVDGGAARGDLLQHAPFLRRDGPLHARRRPRLSGPRDSGDASEGRRQGRAARRSRSPASTRRARRSSSSTSSAAAGRGEARLDIPKIAVDRPQTLAAAVRAGRDGIERLDLRVKVDTEKDERDALVKRTADERVDRTMLSAEQVTAVFANLNRLRAAGLYRDALAYHDLGAVRVTVALGAREQAGHRDCRDARAERHAGAVSRHHEVLLPSADVRLTSAESERAASSSGTRRFRRPRRTGSSRRCRRSRRRPSTRSGRAISARTSGRWI